MFDFLYAEDILQMFCNICGTLIAVEFIGLVFLLIARMSK